ncbi:MAG: SDR family oxidoreductase [Novosphingobium sp.]|nr:SDR family oxidoreductase [Novosphingobium sp.]
MAQRFEDKSVLILGGSSGIGRATAAAFVDEGASVTVTGRDPEKLQAVHDEFGVLAIRSELGNLDETRQAVERAAEASGRLDVLFVNAGAASLGRLAKITPEAWDECYAANVRGCIFAMQYALPFLVEGSSIVVSGSVAAYETQPTVLAYSTAKAALQTAARLIAADLAPRNIRVNTVVIGPTKTELYTRGADPARIALQEKAFADEVPIGRMGDAPEVARAVLFLASDEASFVTGSELLVDGGHLRLSSTRKQS